MAKRGKRTSGATKRRAALEKAWEARRRKAAERREQQGLDEVFGAPGPEPSRPYRLELSAQEALYLYARLSGGPRAEPIEKAMADRLLIQAFRAE